jgi:hypothetical protein
MNLGHSQEDIWRIRKAISEASSFEEVEHLTKLLQAGQIPNKVYKKKSGAQNAGKLTVHYVKIINLYIKINCYIRRKY